MSNSAVVILYVGLDRPGAAPVLERLRAGGASLETLGDVYRALARWGRGRVRPAAVVVCVDGLATSEFEFFKLASRDHAGTPVYVCGPPASAARMQRAIEAGARGVITPDDVEELIHDVLPVNGRSIPEAPQRAGQAPPAEARPAAPAAEPTSISELAIPIVSRFPDPDAENAEPTAELDDEETITDADAFGPAGPARVPWKSYGDWPVRKPPLRPGSTPPTPPPSAVSLFDGPLLTPEELEALMREDFRTRPTPAEGGDPTV